MSKQAPLSGLRSFEAAARHNSFTRAALELNITQAAVSKQIKSLEAQLHCQLFTRHAHGLSLTEQGRRYWLDTRELMQQLDKVTAQFISRQQTRHVQLRCNISYSALVLCQRLPAFRQAHPDIDIEITHDIWEPGNPSHNAHIDIGYRLIDKPDNPQDTRCLLAQDALFPVVAAGIDAATVRRLPLIHVAGYYREWRWWLEQVQILPNAHHYQPGQHDWHVDNSLVAYQLAVQGLGVALGRTSLVTHLLTSGQLQRAEPLTELPAPEGFFISLTPLGQQHRAAQAVFSYLAATAAGLAGSR